MIHPLFCVNDYVSHLLLFAVIKLEYKLSHIC